MSRRHSGSFVLATILLTATAACLNAAEAKRIIVLKIDGLNADLLYRTMTEIDPASGKSRLPWLTHIFCENGAVFDNFYTRGMSLSAPSWSILDTGRHAIIRGNTEFDRYTGFVYDYLNFFPFYIGVARAHRQDMPGVEVLDRAGIPLLIDAYPRNQVFQSPQLYQRGVPWDLLQGVLKAKFSSKSLIATLENGTGPSLGDLLARQTEHDLIRDLSSPGISYLDFYSGDVDHETHATNNPAAIYQELKRIDSLAGRIWTAIQASSDAQNTLLVMVSDHGMNNVPGVFSEAFSLPDILNSPEGGAHHVVTNRQQLSDYKLLGIDPLINRVTTPSTRSFYLRGQSSKYPTAWLDLDGNERASLHLRNSDLNRIHVLLLQLARNDLPGDVRRAATREVERTIERNRVRWSRTCDELTAELDALKVVTEKRQEQLKTHTRTWFPKKRDAPQLAEYRRLYGEGQAWAREKDDYEEYIRHMRALLALDLAPAKPLKTPISDLIPELTLGDNNSIFQLQHYLVGPALNGLVANDSTSLNDEASFRYVNYFSLLASQRVRNNPQAALSSKPIDFLVMALPQESVRRILPECQNGYWVYADDAHELLVLQRQNGDLSTRPVSGLMQDQTGDLHWTDQKWNAGLPLELFEDAALTVPPDTDRATWLSGWHSEKEWFRAVHRCHYSNAVIGITEQFSPVADNVPGRPGLSPTLLRYERRRRQLVQPDLEVFAAEHWNFNVRNFNPGGNHGSFFRISTHSVWMMAGNGIENQVLEEPYDSLNFASTILSIAGKPVPMPDKVVTLR